MYTSSNYKGYSSGQNFKQSRSTDNFYRKATERSLKFQSATSTAADCLACKHEQEQQTFRTSKSPIGFKNIYLNTKNSQEEYYKTNQKQELQHLRKTKRYLEQLLERSKNDHKQSIEIYQTRLAELNQELTLKNNALLEMQKLHNQKQAENCYLANASLVHSYKQMQVQDEDQEQIRARKVKELVRKTTQLQEELSDARRSIEEKRMKVQSLEIQLAKMKDFQFYEREYEAMKLLIGKMQEEKLQLLDRQHNQIEDLDEHHRIELEDQRAKNEELRQQLEEKMFKLTDAERQLHTLRHNFTQFKNEQYQSLRELLQEREKECHSLQSRVNCIQSQLNFVRGRYGYLLRLAQSGQLVDSIVGEQEDFCIERIGRYNISNGKQSLMSMNLSPIKRR